MTSDMNYFEIGTADPAASKAFYGALFDWEIGEPSMPARYSMIDEIGAGCGIRQRWAPETGRSSTSRSEDVPAAIDRAQRFGATVVVPLIDNGGIEFAHLADPAGNRFGIWRPKTD